MHLFPEIDIQRPAGTSIPNGGNDDVGNVRAETILAQTLQYKVDNSTGIADLSLSTPTATNMIGVTSFSAIKPLFGKVKAGKTRTITLFIKVEKGAFSFDLNIENNDSDENPYIIHVSGIGVTPEIDIQRPSGTSIADGGTDNLGDEFIGQVTKTYKIDNTAGGDALILVGPKGENFNNVTDFVLIDCPLTIIPAGGVGSFTIQFKVDDGAFSFDLLIGHNDWDENPYNIRVEGIGIQPEMHIKSSKGDMMDGATFNFSNRYIGHPKEETLKIENLGTGDLILTTPLTFIGSEAFHLEVVD